MHLDHLKMFFFVIVFILLQLLMILAQDVKFQDPIQSSGSASVSDLCLKCLCRTRNRNCDQLKKTCNADTCGPYAISKNFWIDAGSPTLTENSGNSKNKNAVFRACAASHECSERAIQIYVKRFEKNCTEGGQLTCYDHYKIFRQGGYGGCQKPIPAQIQTILDRCLAGGPEENEDPDIDIRFTS